MPTPTRESKEPTPASISTAPSGLGRLSARNSRPSTRKSTPVVDTPTSSKPRGTTTDNSPINSTPQNGSPAAPGEWTEPAPVAPKASYREYDEKALMNTSTTHMLPLGELPSAKILDATKKPLAHQVKKKGKGGKTNGTGGVGWSRAPQANKTPAPIQTTTPTVAAPTPTVIKPIVPPVKATTPALVKATTPAATFSSDATPRTSGSPSATSVTTPKATPPNPWFNGSAPSSKTPQGRQRLSMVVEAAIQRSALVGNVDLGRAIKKLYQESLTDESLANLLDSVLAQKASPQQIQQFQYYVRTARENPEALEDDRPFFSNMAKDERNAANTEEAGQTAAATEKEKGGGDGGGGGGGGGVPTNAGTELGTPVPMNGTAKSVPGNKKTAGKKGPRRKNATKREESESDMASVNSEMPDDASKAVAPSTAASTPQPQPQNGEAEHRAKRIKLPSYEDIKKDSSIRDPPPPPTRTRGSTRKRARSPSITSPPPPAHPGPGSSTAASAPPPAPVTTPPVTFPIPPKKKSKTNKTKFSPVKKATAIDNTVVTAGIGELSDLRRVRYGSEEVSENEDVCAVCNGAGRFLCCERCPRSFHFSCLNPPLEDVPEGMWFCKKCQAQTNPPPKEPRGMFSELLNDLKRRNPTSFRLPVHIRTYFTGVETGALGEYVDTRDTKTQRFNKSGFLEEYDTHKLKDKTGNPVLCHDCGKSAVDGQRIISCDYCPLSWHLDCIRPTPMSNPPSGQKKWMCPAHLDWVLQRRRPKNAPIVDTCLRRGHKNDGLIEIDNEEEDAFEEILMSGIVYRLPERGIKLDFLDKVRRTKEPPHKKIRLENGQSPPPAIIASTPTPISERMETPAPETLIVETPVTGTPVTGTPVAETLVTETLVTETPVAETPVAETPVVEIPLAQTLVTEEKAAENRSVVDKEIISALVELSTRERTHNQLNDQSIKNLIQSLIDQASPAVLALYHPKNHSSVPPLSPAASTADSAAENEVQQLMLLQNLIAKRLRILQPATVTPTPPAEPNDTLETVHVPVKTAIQFGDEIIEEDTRLEPEPGPNLESGHQSPGLEIDPDAEGDIDVDMPMSVNNAAVAPMGQKTQPAPVAPMAPMAPVAPMAPMATFTKQTTPK